MSVWRPAEERFFAKVDKTDTCWLWTAATINGYGRFGLSAGRQVKAHRWSYEFHVGPIPEGLQLDHLCRVRNCVNPAHLEPVTATENNVRRPDRTHCPAGHEFTEANTYIPAKWPKASLRPPRHCRTCNTERARARRLRLADLKAAS